MQLILRTHDLNYKKGKPSKAESYLQKLYKLPRNEYTPRIIQFLVLSPWSLLRDIKYLEKMPKENHKLLYLKITISSFTCPVPTWALQPHTLKFPSLPSSQTNPHPYILRGFPSPPLNRKCGSWIYFYRSGITQLFSWKLLAYKHLPLKANFLQSSQFLLQKITCQTRLFFQT